MNNFAYVDTHTHVNIAAFTDDWREVTDRALVASVAHINVGTQQDTARKAIEIAEAYEEGVYAIVGLHPVHTAKSFHDPQELGEEAKGFTSRGEQFDMELYRELASHEKVVAIGECGLDYYRLDVDTLALQRSAFIEQIELANELEKPLMLHIRPGTEGDAYRDAWEILKSHAKVPGNVHFFAGSVDDARRFFDIGYTISVTGVITFTKDYDEVVAYTPLDMLHAETDAPYVAPKPYRGQRNEPLHVREVVAQIAALKNADLEMVRMQLRENARRLYGV